MTEAQAHVSLILCGSLPLCCAARRLNYRLNEACETDIELLCAQECSPFGAQACGGRVLRCLTEKQDSIKSKVRD